MLTLIAAACWAVYTVFGATILRRHSPLVTTTWAIVAGTLFIAPLGIAQLATTDLSGSSDLPVVFAILYSGTLAAGLRQRHRPPRREAARADPGHRPPVPRPGRSRSVMAAVFLDEPIRPIQVVGGAIILAGVALLRRGSWPGRGRARRGSGVRARRESRA